MNKSELQEIKKALLARKNDLAQEFKTNKQEGDNHINQVGDSLDQAADSYEREMLFELNDLDKASLESIETTLIKIDNGTYGICEKCKKKIDIKRIKAKPEALYCVNCQSKSET